MNTKAKSTSVESFVTVVASNALESQIQEELVVKDPSNEEEIVAANTLEEEG